MTTVDKIMKQFTKTITQLDNHAEYTSKLVSDKQTQIENLEAGKIELQAEKDKATKLSNKLKEIFYG